MNPSEINPDEMTNALADAVRGNEKHSGGAMDVVTDVGEGVVELGGEGIIGAVADAAGGALEAVGGAVGSALEVAGDVAGAALEVAGDVAGAVIGGIVESLGS